MKASLKLCLALMNDSTERSFDSNSDLRLPSFSESVTCACQAVAMSEVPRFWTFGGLIPVTEGYGRIRVKEERVIRRFPERAQD